MRVTRAEEYGVRLVMCLAAKGKQMTIRDMALCEQLPQPTVAKVVNRLRRAGVVSAVRGRFGGYTLARPTAEISLASIVNAFDRLDASFCERMRSQGELCSHEDDCDLRPVWNGLASVIHRHLSGITVADIISGRLATGAVAVQPDLRYQSAAAVSL